MEIATCHQIGDEYVGTSRRRDHPALPRPARRRLAGTSRLDGTRPMTRCPCGAPDACAPDKKVAGPLTCSGPRASSDSIPPPDLHGYELVEVSGAKGTAAAATVLPGPRSSAHILFSIGRTRSAEQFRRRGQAARQGVELGQAAPAMSRRGCPPAYPHGDAAGAAHLHLWHPFYSGLPPTWRGVPGTIGIDVAAPWASRRLTGAEESGFAVHRRRERRALPPQATPQRLRRTSATRFRRTLARSAERGRAMVLTGPITTRAPSGRAGRCATS